MQRIARSSLDRKYKKGRNWKTKFEFLNINIIFRNAGKFCIPLKKPQLTIADSYDPNHCTAYGQQLSYSVPPLEPFTVFSWTDLKWNIIQGFLNLTLRKHQKQTQEVKKPRYNYLFLAVVTVLVLFTEEIRPASHAFFGL